MPPGIRPAPKPKNQTYYDKIGGGGVTITPKNGGGDVKVLPKTPAQKASPDTAQPKKTSGPSIIDLVNKVVNSSLDSIANEADRQDQEAAAAGSGGGGGGGSKKKSSGKKRSSGGGSSGGMGTVPAAEVPAFVDPMDPLRKALQAVYLGNGVDPNSSVQAYLGKLSNDAQTRVKGYSADAMAQSAAAGQGIQANLAAVQAAQAKAQAAAQGDLAAQGAQAAGGKLTSEGLAAQSNMAGAAAGQSALTSRMADIFNQQSADRLAGVTNTGQYAQGQAAANYTKMLSTLDMQTAQAKAQYDAMLAGGGGAAGGGGGGGGGGRGGRGGGGGSSASGDGTYQDTMTRTLTDSLTNQSSMTDTDLAELQNKAAWDAMTPSDKSAVSDIQTYIQYGPEVAAAFGIDINKIAKTNPGALIYLQTVNNPNAFGNPYSKNSSQNQNSQTQYNRDQTVTSSKYTSPKVKGGPPAPPTQTGGGQLGSYVRQLKIGKR